MKSAWTESKAEKAIEEACAALDLPASAARLVCLGSAATYRIGDMALRVAPPGSDLSAVSLELELAQELKAQGVPALEPFARAPLKLRSGQVVSLWHYLEHSSETQVPAKAFGRILGDFHDATRSSKLKLPKLHVMKGIERRLDHVESAGLIAQDDVDMLRLRAEKIAKQLKRVKSKLGDGVVHGDAHPGNVIVGPLGPVLSDFERAARGPLEWDLIPMALKLERYGLPERDWAAFCDGYGYDVREWEGYGPSVAAQALSVTCVALANYSRHRSEAETRLRFWRQFERGRPSGIWQAILGGV